MTRLWTRRELIGAATGLMRNAFLEIRVLARRPDTATHEGEALVQICMIADACHNLPGAVRSRLGSDSGPDPFVYLRQHLDHHGTAADGRLFRGSRGGILSESIYGRAWHAARLAWSASRSSTPSASRVPPLAARQWPRKFPYTSAVSRPPYVRAQLSPAGPSETQRDPAAPRNQYR